MATSLKPTFSVNSYDRDGDLWENGIYLHFGSTRIKVAETMEEFKDFISHLQVMSIEIEENY